MDHVVYVDAREKELEKILSKEKTMIIRGAAGRKMPYGRVYVNDVLYFINNNAEGVIKAKGVVSSVFNSEKMTKEESTALVNNHQNQLQLTEKQFTRWAGKRYLVLIGIYNIEAISSFAFDKSQFENMDDWLPVEHIDSVKIK